MVGPGADMGQAALEKKQLGFLPQILTREKPLRRSSAVCRTGVLELGPYRLLLLPVNREWWFWEPRIHNDWQYTGYHAGEIIFSLDGQNIELIQKEKTPVGSAIISGGTGQRFCQQCGSPLKTA